MTFLAYQKKQYVHTTFIFFDFIKVIHLFENKLSMTVFCRKVCHFRFSKKEKVSFAKMGHEPGGYSTLGWVRMCGPKFRPPPYNKTREDANLQPITKPFASWRTLFKTNQYFLPYKLGCISTFWQPIGKLKGKIQRKLCILQICNLYLNQFSNKKGAIGKPERPKKHPIWAAHPRTHLSTK